MTAVHADELIEGYLSRLELQLLDMPADRRTEIVDELRDHIAEERRALPSESDADLLNILDRVGDPAAIAAEARAGRTTPSEPPRQVGAVEILALVLTPLIWPVGVILLWASPAWTTRQKLIGTLLPPGGYLGAVFVLPALLLQSTCVIGTDSTGRVVENTCPQGWDQVFVGGGLIAVTIALLVLPVVVGIYLATRLRRSARNA